MGVKSEYRPRYNPQSILFPLNITNGQQHDQDFPMALLEMCSKYNQLCLTYLRKVANYMEALGVILSHYIEQEGVCVVVQGLVVQKTFCQ